MKQLLREIFLEWKEFEIPEIKKREIDPTRYTDWNVIKIVPVIGFRRVGKTYLLFSIAKKLRDKTLYINFEDSRLDTKSLSYYDFYSVLREIYGNEKLVLLLDEIQVVPEWSRWIRTLHDTRNYQIFVSGSSSKLSSREIPTELRGRTITVTLYPLSFREFLTFRELNYKELSQSLILRELREYLFYGGMPEIVLSEKGKKYLLIDEYFQTFVTRDVFERYNIRNREVIKTLINMLLNSTYFTVSKLHNTLNSLGYKIGKATLLNYVSYLSQTFFIDFLEVFSPSIKRALQAPRKVYFIDNFFLTKHSSKFSQNLGRLMENVVFLELRRRQNKRPTMEIYYWKDYYGKEVDFVVREGLRVKELIQVTYASGIDEMNRREIKGLLKASKELKCKDLSVITWDHEGEEKAKGKEIKFIPLWKWLLGDS